MAVHLYGNPVQIDPILSLSSRHGIPIVEDFAEAQGAAYRSAGAAKPLLCGAIGEISATSFYANKIITCGEGGMVLCRTARAAERARRYRNLGFGPSREFVHDDIGANLRMTNMQAAVGLAQLEQLDRAVALKRQIGDWYRAAFRDAGDLLRFHPVPDYSDPVYWMFCVELEPRNGVDAATACATLAGRGVATRPFFTGMHRQPVLLKRGLFAGEAYPNTDHATRYGFYLPSAISLTRDTVESIANTLVEILKTTRLTFAQ
jgi:perosamine synthetase